MAEDENITKLMEEHKDDFEPIEASPDDKGSDDGGDKGQDKPEDEVDGSDDSPKDDDAEPSDSEDSKEGEESKENEGEPVKPDDSDESEVEPVGEKKDANSRIRQLNEEKKAILAEKKAVEESKRQIEQQLADREIAERKQIELTEDPIYKLEDFLGTVDENGDPLTDGEATARFRAWESDYKLRAYQKQQVMIEQQNTLISLQNETKEAFTKFPEFNSSSDKYDPELAAIANDAFRAGLIYSPGHENDDRFIIGSRINPGELLTKLHKLRVKEASVTKVNNLGDDNGSMVSSQQVNKKANTYAPGFRGEVDAQLDKLLKEKK